MARRFVIGDIHGAFRAFKQCLERSSFDYDNDMLICLGDLVDRWTGVKSVFDELLKVKNLVLLLGNHDQWALKWFLSGDTPEIWLMQGGKATIDSYAGKKIPDSHIKLLQNARLYYIMENKLFVHGGILPDRRPDAQDAGILLWDRTLVNTALNLKNLGMETNITGFECVYIGHTPTIKIDSTKPVKACEIIMMDTGAGWPGGMLSIMNIDNEEVFQSDVII